MRVAIYVRKSVEVKDSVSIDTQIQMCKNYFADQNCEFEVFADDGYTGANTERPAFKRLNKKLQLGLFDALICYKLDRISRKVLDIADFFELLEKQNIAFICVKDKYDTSTPMGRAMLYFASVFAQLERETIAERVRDSMLNLAKKGCWTGGPAPAGYKLVKEGGKSYIELENKNFIEDCFNLYLELGSLYATHKNLIKKYPTITPKQRENIRRILRSPVYVKSSENIDKYLKENSWVVVGTGNGKGYLTYGVTTGEPMAIVSKHKAIIEPTLWLKVQEKLDFKKEDYFKKDSKIYWLSSLLKCPFCGGEYVLVNSAKNTYYACGNRIKRGREKTNLCSNAKYVNAIYIETVVEKHILSCKERKDFDSIYKSYDEKNLNMSEIDVLKDKIKKNDEMIANLVDKLALLKNADPIIKKINDLEEENKKINEKIEEYKLHQLEIENNNFGKEYVYENIVKFDSSTDNKVKRIIARNVYKSLIYNPYTKELKIEFL